MNIANYLLPGLILLIVLCALWKRVHAYQSFVDGAKEGMGMFLSVYPALLGMMCAISLLRESGFLTMLCDQVAKVIPGLPSSIWPMVFFRPVSGSASLAVLIDIFQSVGVDSLAGVMASIIQGSTDTTVYVITLYFSTVGIKKIKNALSIGLLADVAGISMAILLTMIFFS